MPCHRLAISEGVRHWGYTPTGLLPSGNRLVHLVRPEDAAIVFPEIPKAELSLNPLLSMLDRARHKSGVYRWCRDRETVVSGAKPGMSRFIGLATDIDNLVEAGGTQVPADRRIGVVGSTQR